MNSRIVIFIVAFLCIAVGVMGILPYINNSNQATTQEQKKKKPEVRYTLWFSHNSFQEGDPVPQKSLYSKTMPEKEAQAYGFNHNVKITYKKGMVANQEIEEGMPVTQSLFSVPGESDYIGLILTPNHVPYGFQIDGGNTIGSIIHLGDRIDILAMTVNDLNLSNEPVSNKYNTLELTTVLTGVRVLSVNTTQVESKNKKKVELPKTFSEIVVELTQEQLSKFLVVQEVANIKIVKHMENLDNPYHAKISTVFPEQREIRQLRGGSKAIDEDMVVESVPVPNE